MKKITLMLLMISLLMITGCKDNNPKNLYLPEAKKDKVFTAVGDENKVHQGEGYTITLPSKDYRYKKEFDDGALEEKWEYMKKDDVQIKVTTYKNSDERSARGMFLRENEDYIFEDLLGYPLCGQELDGDTLWFTIHVSGKTVYIVSWEYPNHTKDDLKTELANIADTFRPAE